jgi:protoheme IX farnesyltransferase
MPMGQKNRKAVVQIIIYTCCLIIVSVIPVLRLTGNFYIYPITAVILVALGSIMLYYAIKLYKFQTNKEARQLMLSSVLYITLIQIIYVIDKFLH